MTALEAAGPTRPSLLLQLRDRQNTKAWETFHEVYAPLIKNYAQRKGLQDGDADDVTQQVMMAVTKSIGSFEYAPEKGSFRSWLGQVVYNHLKKFWSRSASKVPLANAANLPPLEEMTQSATSDIDPEWLSHFTEHVLSIAMQRICAEFEPNTWTMFLGVWEQKQPPQTIAKLVGSTVRGICGEIAAKAASGR
ncbi:MAG: sigma-70 family RNA polymerase sigma factor [Gemmataceae bacterium]